VYEALFSLDEAATTALGRLGMLSKPLYDGVGDDVGGEEGLSDENIQVGALSI
jgi:hypothetical protein